jgi:hypothetical protein
MAFPLHFAIPNNEAELAWGRAQSYIGRFSSMKLQVATDYVIQTYNPESAWEFGYTATRTPGINHALFDVGCQTGGTLGADEAEQNAHIFAYYIKTGLAPPDTSLIAPY